MHYDGIIIGLASFAIIGFLHPVVIKGEYHFGTRIWPLFLAAGIACAILSVLSDIIILRAILGVTSFSLFWSILELFHQKRRVEKGWYPENPGRKRR